jgi:hypothetical protein
MYCLTRVHILQPLFFECIADRNGLEISRSHVGLGYQGFMSDQGPAATLYHTYMSYRSSSQGLDPNELPPDASK